MFPFLLAYGDLRRLEKGMEDKHDQFHITNRGGEPYGPWGRQRMEFRKYFMVNREFRAGPASLTPPINILTFDMYMCTHACPIHLDNTNPVALPNQLATYPVGQLNPLRSGHLVTILSSQFVDPQPTP
jgi:hypothetical protein